MGVVFMLLARVVAVSVQLYPIHCILWCLGWSRVRIIVVFIQLYLTRLAFSPEFLASRGTLIGIK